MTLAVVRPGLLTTVQDLGRAGYGSLGVPPCGAMDAPALRAANRLVGNPDDLAGLELTLAGPELRFEGEAWIALAGSRFECDLDGAPAPWAESLAVRRGQRLRIGRSLEGARAYLAVAGGFDVPRVLGSRSTCLTAGFGGIEGRALRAGDRLPLGSPRAPRRRRLRGGVLPAYAAQAELRVVRGPQSDAFTEEGDRAFFAAAYRVSARSNRIGLRLEGAPIERSRAADLLPEGLAPGSIQVPADGQPILLGPDRPTTGGYTKIATAITVDLGRAAQAKPGDRLRFAEVSVEEARRLYRDFERLLGSGIEDVP